MTGPTEPLLAPGGFHLVCEIEPPTRPDLDHVREQIEVLLPVAGAFLIPDNHLGRATVSSIAVAHEVAALGGRSIACINARDRNLLGLRRDFLTAAAYGVEHFLFVYGDAPSEGSRSGDLTVRGMIEEVRSFGAGPLFEGYPPFRVGAVARPGRPLGWKVEADFLFGQISFDGDEVVRWRESVDYPGPVYAGVIVLASSRMARRLAEAIPEIDVPADLVDKLDADPEAGLDLACRQIDELRESGAFDGVHLVPVRRYAEMTARLLELGPFGGM